MKNWKIIQIMIFAAMCILLNLGGRTLTAHYNLMFWLDSVGTVLCSYVGGPLCGAIVGVTSNLIYSMVYHSSYIYALVSLIIAVIVGFAAKRGMFNTLFGTMSVSAITALSCLVVSVPLNIAFFDGYTGNIWGNGVLNYLAERGWPLILCQIIGAFYLEFLDKFITLLLLYILLKIIRLILQKIRSVRAQHFSKHMDDVLQIVPLLLLFSLSALLLSEKTYAEEIENVIDYDDYVQTVFSSSNGLPCGEANDIEQTNDGILWIGTYAGLYRYNGSEFRWMDNYESVRNVNCLYVDEEGRLWIGTNDNGLSISINEKISNVLDEANGLPSNSVRSIIQGSDGYYYVGTTGSMQILALNDGLKKIATLREIVYADKIAADNNGHVATITSDGRLFLLKNGQIKSSLRIFGNDIFNSCCFDPEGYLLAGTSSNIIYRYDVSEDGFNGIDSIQCSGLMNLNDLYYLENGEMFVAADNGIGYVDTKRQFHLINVNTFNNSIDNVLMDYQNNLWFTSSRLGLLRLAQSAFKDVYSTVGMESRVVNSVARWDDCYFFGTDKGLDIVDETCRRQITNELTRQLNGVRIRCIMTDSHGSIWLCTYGSGLLEIEEDGTQHLYNADNGSFGNRARMTAELSDGTILAAGDTGISFIEDHKVTNTIGYADGLINSMILTVTEMSDGTILAGTDGDGIAMIRDHQVERMLTREDGLSSGVILRSVKDPDGSGIFLITSNGLCYMETDYSIRTLDNFPYFNNYDIWAKDNHTLFVLSSAGIYVVNRDDLVNDVENMSCDLLDSRRGLNSALTANSWNYADDQGHLFLSCDKSVYIMDTERYALTTRSYRINLTLAKLDNVPRTVEQDRIISINHGANKLELFPEIINYTIQDPNTGYYLEGVDKGWTIMPQSNFSNIVYTNIPSGEYTLHLAVFDNNRENILEERLFRVIKEKEIYDESWFIFYIIVVAMLFIAWIPWFFMQRALASAQKKIQLGNETIIAIANAVDAKDTSTSQHSYRVSVYSAQIAQRMGFSKKQCENIRKAARMHDIGKIGIPDRVLNKPGRLTDEEYAIMKSHVTRGSEILGSFTLIDHVVEGARFHHERYDGKGYPEGLKGEEIPLYGRIIGVADAFDAMTANRIYRKKLDFEYVLGELRRGRGTQFDPECVDILLQLIEDGDIDIKAMYPDLPPEEITEEAIEEKILEQPAEKPGDKTQDKPQDTPQDKTQDKPQDDPQAKKE